MGIVTSLMKQIIFHAFLFLCFFPLLNAQTSVTKDIKSFGAKGDGITNDQSAFEKAATFFNDRGGNGKLTISAGTYIIGNQIYTGNKPNSYAYTGKDVLHFTHVSNFSIEGTAKSILKYADNLRFGSFDPKTRKRYDHSNGFYNTAYVAAIGYCIYFDNCTGVSINHLSLDGNSKAINLGGGYGDVGIQLPHYGIFIKDCHAVVINYVIAHHFACDGICISNIASTKNDGVQLLNSSFTFNARQGLSWIGGNDLTVNNCKFDHSGKGNFYSPPGAGVDVEAEIGPVKNGRFTNCEFIDNTGPGMVTDQGNDSECSFSKCTFWGTTNWSIWVNKPAFTFTDCNVYGSFVWGYDSPDEKNATKFLRCSFEDKPYNGIAPYGNFLVESNFKKRLTFTDCNFTANKKKLCWIELSSNLDDEKCKFLHCVFTVKNAGYQKGDFVAVMRGVLIENSIFNFANPDAKSKNYYIEGFTKPDVPDKKGNKAIYQANK